MGFGQSGAALILFIGAIAALGAAFPVVEQTAEDYSTALDNQRDSQIDIKNTEINITNATYDDSIDSVVITVENTGSTTLSLPKTDVLADGEYQTGYNTEVQSDTSRTIWMPNETLTITVSYGPPAPDRVKIITENGLAETAQVN